MGYPGGRNSYANGQGPNGFFGAKLGTGFGDSGIENAMRGQLDNNNSTYRKTANFLYSDTFQKFAKGGAIAGGVMGVATAAGVGIMGFEKFFKKQAGITTRQKTPEVLMRGATAGLAVGAVYGLILTGMAGYQSV